MFVNSISNHHEQQHIPIIHHNYDDIIIDHDQECPDPAANSLMLMKEGKRSWKSNNEIAPNCPRCASTNTKFCYYNNYSLSQPRYFCKGCRRYWTKGGSLRNVPVGGGCRKSRRSSKSARGSGGGLNNNNNNKYQLIPSPSPAGSADSNNNIYNNNTSDGSNIDLAAVFAKFLNQDSSFIEEDDDNDGTTTTSSASPPEMMMMMPSDHMSGDDYNVHHQMENILFESPHDEQLIQSSDLLVDDFGCYSCSGTSNFYYDDQSNNLQEIHDHDQPLLMEEFEGILRGDGHEDNQNNDNNFMGWTNSSNLPNLDMQNIVQFQDLGPFSIDDHQALFVPNVVACEDWNSFDLSGY